MSTMAEWRGRVGAEWAAKADALDRFLGPPGDAAFGALGVGAGWRVLDLGCGAGASSLQLAATVGAEGEVVGVDISPDLIARAEERLALQPGARARFLLVDAATGDLGGPFDALYSRFGGMFFDEPVAAFAHLRAAMKPGAPAAMTAWRDPKINEWATLPLRLAADVLGEAAAPPAPGAPGPFSWASPDLFAPILSGAGWRGVDWLAADGDFPLSAGEDPDPVVRAVAFVMRIGPLASRLAGKPQGLRSAVEVRLAKGFAPLVVGGEVRLKWAAWVITARA